MTAAVIPFPARGPFAVHIAREESEWLVVCRSHDWVHASKEDAKRDAEFVASGFGVAVVERVR